MAWRNIWRNPRRSILTIMAIGFASALLVFMLSWQFGSYETMINSAVKINTGHLQVQATGYKDKRDIRRVVSDPESIGALLEHTPEVAAFTYRANAFSLISSEKRTYGALVVGIDPKREPGVSTLKKLIRKGLFFAETDTDQALVGHLLAENLQVDLGDEIVILGQGRDGSIAATVVKIKGIFNSGLDEFDRGILHIPIRYFQDVYTMSEAVHEVVAVGNSLKDVQGMKTRIKNSLPRMMDQDDMVVFDWMELMPGLIEAIKMDLVSGFIMYIILILVVAFSILNTFLMVVFERTREFGLFMAMGTTPGRLTKLLMMESAAMTLMGIFSGIIAGSLITYYFQIHGILIPGATEIMRQFGLPDRMYPQLSLLSLSIGPGVVLIITFLTALYPALRVRRLKPVEAMTAI